MASTILLNYGAIHPSCTEAFSRSEKTQPTSPHTPSHPPAPDAGSCKGHCDRHQLSMSNYYSKVKVDAGQRPKRLKQGHKVRDTEYLKLNTGLWIMHLMVQMNIRIKDKE